MLNERNEIFAGDVAIVQSQDSNSLALPTIIAQHFFRETGDINKSVQLAVFPSEAADETPWVYIKGLFGVWVESGNEDKQIEDLYQSRIIPSSMPNEEE